MSTSTVVPSLRIYQKLCGKTNQGKFKVSDAFFSMVAVRWTERKRQFYKQAREVRAVTEVWKHEVEKEGGTINTKRASRGDLWMKRGSMLRLGKYNEEKARIVFRAAWLDAKRRATRDQEDEPEDVDSKEEAEGVDLDLERLESDTADYCTETLRTLGYSADQVWNRMLSVW